MNKIVREVVKKIYKLEKHSLRKNIIAIHI